MSDTSKIDSERVDSLRKAFDEDFHLRFAQNAVAKTTVQDVLLNHKVTTELHYSFSHRLDNWECCNQKSSGRCWCFAALNMLRSSVAKTLNVSNFEFSQNWTLFWDKFERANWFLQAIVDTAGDDIGSRTVSFLLDQPTEDGGQWNMFVSLVKKYGLVPKVAMPETESSSSTRRMNQSISTQLRTGATRLRAAVAKGEDVSDLRKEILDGVWRILCIHLGTPPEKFNWQWNDKDRKFGTKGVMTPLEFAKEYISHDLDEYVALVHDPRNPRNQTYTVKYLGNVVGGDPVVYVNVDPSVLKHCVATAIQEGETVWMGCDVGKYFNNKLGLWHLDLYDYDGLYGTKFDMSKEERLNAHDTLMTHAMLFTGVDIVEGDGPLHSRIRRYAVENSWGSDGRGEKGFHCMDDAWFDEHVFEIAVRKKYVKDFPEVLAALEKEPTVLPPWDPMGALARETAQDILDQN